MGLGSIMRLTGDKVMNTFLGNIQEEKSKMKKVNLRGTDIFLVFEAYYELLLSLQTG